MKAENIFTNIPSGKYHSALLTAYSINLYYWEIQVLKALSAKGIEYVSALVDEECLSEQLQHFSREIGIRKPKQYSLHGFRAKGAFHPKVMFFAGRDRALALVGSGNLTSCGHGRNLEVWTPIAVDSKDSPAYPLLRDIWCYVQKLYLCLGSEAGEIIRTVQSNCSLLEGVFDLSDREYNIGGGRSIRFMSNANSGTIFSQLLDWTGEDEISSITVLSPFYDQNARLLSQLEDNYHPTEFNIIVESGSLGNLPLRKTLPKSCKVYNWQKCKMEGLTRPHNFHAKCFYLKGEKYNYLLCGSANASIAAMGGNGSVSSMNYEACIGIKSAEVDFLSESGFSLPADTFLYEDSKEGHQNEAHGLQEKVWLKEVSVSGFEVKIAYEIDDIIDNITLVLESADHRNKFEAKNNSISSQSGEAVIKIPDIGFVPIIAWLADRSGKRVSGYQFVIHTHSMHMVSPDPENVVFRKNCRCFENGDFYTDGMLSFIEEMFGNRIIILSKHPAKEEKKPLETEHSETREFSSYEEYMQGNYSSIDANSSVMQHYQKNSVLLDSVLAFAERSASKFEEDSIDEEIDNETDNVSRTSGKNNKKRESIPDANQATLAKKVTRIYGILNRYISELEPEVLNVCNSSSDAFVMIEELKRFITALYLANRLIGFSSRCNNGQLQKILHEGCPLKFSTRNRNNLTELVYRTIALFGLYVIRHKRIEEPSSFYKQKLDHYTSYAFELCLALVSVCDWINQENNTYARIRDYYKQTAMLNIQWAFNYFPNDETVYRSLRRIDSDLLRSDSFDRNEAERSMGETIKKLNSVILIHDFPTVGQFYLDDKIGHAFVGKVNTNYRHFVPYTIAARYNEKTGEFQTFFFTEPKKLIPSTCAKLFDGNKFIRPIPK